MPGHNTTTPKRRVSVVWGGSRGSKAGHGEPKRNGVEQGANRQRRHFAGQKPFQSVLGQKKPDIPVMDAGFFVRRVRPGTEFLDPASLLKKA